VKVNFQRTMNVTVALAERTRCS